MRKNLAKQVLEQFHKEYDFIYEAQRKGLYVAGYDEAMSFGDKLLEEMPEILKEVIQLRGDIFTSDREVAALGFAFVEKIMG